MKRKLKWIVPLAALLILVVGSAVYVETYYHADSAAMAALASDDTVQITRTDYGWFFDGPSEENALIFYPGAKVEETAYAPLLHQLAAEGLDVCLVKMPFRLAILGMNRADSVVSAYDYAHWYIGGHSLGGACSTSYAAAHGDDLEGVILLAAYPMKQLDDDLTTVFIYGSEDHVLNRERYNDSRQYAPADAAEFVIEGGNHAQFGAYGEQAGDGQAEISPSEQVEETVRDILLSVSGR